MKLLKRAVFILVSVVGLSACSQQQDKEGTLWQADEILLHLTELRKEVVSLRKEVESLKSNLDKVSTRKGRKAATSIPLSGQVSMGDENAQIAIVEFSDYQCPYCVRHAQKVYPDIKKNYVDTGKVKYFTRNFPLGFHAKARGAAIVAECAGQQGKLWPVHEFLFDNSRQLGDVVYDKMVKEFSLDKDKFEACRKDTSVAEKVDADMILGQRAGVSGTPKFFVGRIKNNKLINVVPLNGAQPYKAFERVINALDKKS